MRIVLDTNVLISALLWRGTPYQLLQIIRQRDGLQLYSSPTLLAELTDVLTRPAAAKRLRLISKSPRELIADYIEAAADLIVSGDRDLLDLGAYRYIRILNPATALELITANQR